ncbi:hypothetical protein [Funiculus sociatus]
MRVTSLSLRPFAYGFVWSINRKTGDRTGAPPLLKVSENAEIR